MAASSRFAARYLQLRTGMYVYRQATLERWHKLAGKREFKESLGPSDQETATVRYFAVHARAEALFQNLKMASPPTPGTTHRLNCSR